MDDQGTQTDKEGKQKMRIEISRYTDLKLLTHVIDIDTKTGKTLRIFNDFSCKFTDDPILFQPYTTITNRS